MDIQTLKRQVLPNSWRPAVSYHSPLPNDIAPWYAYLQDAGHSIVCVLKSHYTPDVADITRLMIPVPVRTVLRGYEINNGIVIVDIPYDPILGLVVPEEDDEYTTNSAQPQQLVDTQTAIAVGESFTIPAAFGEAVIPEIVGESFNIIAWMESLTENEVQEWRTGPIEYGISVIAGIPIVSFKIGTLHKFDVTFNFVKENSTKIDFFRDGATTNVTLILIDYPSNIIKGLRMVGLQPQFMSFLRYCVEDQRSRYPTSLEVNQATDHILDQVPTWQQLWDVTVMKFKL